MIALILGAGFSKWAADLPLASQLFDFAVQPHGKIECRRLSLLMALKSSWDSNNPDGTPEQFIASTMSLSDDPNRHALLWYIVRRLSQPYIWEEWHSGRLRRHVLMIDEYRTRERPGVADAHAFIHALGTELQGIITLNYDLLVEYALGTTGFNYGTVGETLQGRGSYPVSQWRSPVRVRGLIPLAKLHGSISWDCFARYTDGRRGLTGNALIVAPTPEKTAPASLRDQWELAARIVGGSSNLVVFGFAFNEYDSAVRLHLAACGSRLKKVVVIDMCPENVVARASALWPLAKYELQQPPEKDNISESVMRIQKALY